jgi:4-diphosphocytidyl-2-C-methyl-D-erythritol kinase
LQPVIGEVLEAIKALPGALLARMSGSGATCFGVFADDDCCRRAADTLAAAAPGWWVAPSFVPESGIVHEEVGQDIGPSDRGL